MRTIALFFALAAAAILQSGCSAGGSAGHDDHRHGAAVSATTSGPGVGAGARAY